MATPSLPPLNIDERLRLRLENRMRNIFVTQLEENREEEDDTINFIPVVTESKARILETGLNTLQKTLVLKKKEEVDQVDRELAQAREEFKGRMEVLEQRKADLKHKQQETKERAVKFEKFVEENEMKRRRALKKYQAERKQNEQKQKEREELIAQLERLQGRLDYLKRMVTKYKKFEDYLMKIIDIVPDNYLEYGSDSLVMPIIRRHETLSNTQQDLVERLGLLGEELEQGQRNLDNLKQDHNTHQLIINKELAELQIQWDKARERNIQLEVAFQTHQGQTRDQAEEVGNLLVAVRNLGEQCYLSNYGPLENIDILSIMDMIKEYMLEKADVERRAKRLTNFTSISAVNGKEKGQSLDKNSSSSRVHLRSISKGSQKSGGQSSTTKVLK
ncbi:uncharacterized protein CCDC197 [Denticeps clupeoides]|uniref:uncharacterized protein CCDC197 n=1 Tax=Denticeps clupeoides TaxID=299321 RepID=UPI0010A40E85|nr:uncharacterized protein CCDC197 [Denticeps clupeoides]